MMRFFHELGGMFLFVWALIKAHFAVFSQSCAERTAFRKLVFEQLANVGMRSVTTVCFSGFFVGAIIVIQMHLMLSKYDATSILGGLNTSACVREVAPLIISFLLAGKIGAFTTAELGTMAVTEQIDAIRCLGKDPLQYIVLPRYIAILVCSILLLVFGLVVSLAGSLLIADINYNINFLQYLQSVPRFTNSWTVFCGVFKSSFYGTIVATVSTYRGYHTTGGAKGVGRAVTNCAVYTHLLIVLANAFSSLFLSGLHEVLELWGHI